MKFDDFCNIYTKSISLIKEKRGRGRPSTKSNLYAPSAKAFNLDIPDDSVEGQILQYIRENPATLGELIQFLRERFDEYSSIGICKAKIDQMRRDDIIAFADKESEASGSKDDESIATLDPIGDDDYNPHDYIGRGALDDYRRSQGHIGGVHDY